MSTQVPEIASARVAARPMWIAAGQLGVILALFVTSGAPGNLEIAPKLFVLLLFLCVATTLVLGPVRQMHHLIVSAPVLVMIGWWLASYLWTYDLYGWRRDTQVLIPLIVALVVLVGLLPVRDFQRALVVGCYLGIAYTVLVLVTDPVVATVNPDGVPGWRGGFIHKNEMAPFMVFSILTLACFERPSARRNTALAVAAALVVLSQSTTSLAAGVAVLVGCAFLWRLSTADPPSRAVISVAATGFALAGAVFAALYSHVLLDVRGKDASLTSRTDIWERAATAVGERPWTGYGAGGVWTDLSAEPARTILRDLGFAVFHTHNGFIEILLLLGVVGLAIFSWLTVSTVRLAVGLLRTAPSTSVFTLGYVILVLLVSITEVATLGIWLALLCTLNCLLLKMRTDPSGRLKGALAHPGERR